MSCLLLQFADVAHFQTLDFSSVWPAVTISDSSTATGGLTASAWNYGSNFGGKTSTSWTSGKDTVHNDTSSTGGMFGSFGVEDTTNAQPDLCAGVASSVCRG
jgi:hypothetical protein